MSAYIYTVTMKMALSAATTQTALVLKPASAGPLWLIDWEATFDGSAAAAGLECQLITQTTDGTGTATPPTPSKWNRRNDRAAQFTTLWKLSAEGSLGVILEHRYAQPFGGGFIKQYPLGTEPHAVESGDRFGFRFITPSGVTPNVALTVTVKEG